MNKIIHIGGKDNCRWHRTLGATIMFFRRAGGARQSDLRDCPIPGHGRDNGVSIALHRYRRSGGCPLLSSLPEASAI